MSIGKNYEGRDKITVCNGMLLPIKHTRYSQLYMQNNKHTPLFLKQILHVLDITKKSHQCL